MRKNTHISRLSLAFSVLCLIFFLGSCKDEFKYDIPEIDPIGDSEVAVVFQMKAPNTKEVGETTRALSIDDERAVKELRVLMFTVDASSGEEFFAYEAKVLALDEIKKQATVTLKLSTAGEQYRAVLVANAGTPFLTAFTAGATKEAVLKQLSFDATGKWNSNSSADFTPLPMLGESAPALVHGAAVAKPFATVKLLRAVARVDVGLCLGDTPQFNEQANQGDTSGLNGFTLSKVYVYNSNTKGYVGRVGALDSAPSVPDNVTQNGVLAYDVTGELTLREIYLSEVVNAETTNHMERPFLVIEGIYKGKTTFYRIDYLKAEANSAGETTYTYLPLLRNHRYKVNITKIGGRGFDTQEEAAKSTAVNIAYDVTVWNESSLTKVIYDGQYMLGVSEDNLTFYNREETQQITVRTSWLDGWKAAITSPNSEEWLKIDKATGVANTDVSLNITVKNNTAPDAAIREGVITITAGRMSWDVKVEQSNEGIVSIKITGHVDQLDAGKPIIVRKFTAKAETKKITVEYLPVDAAIKGPEGLTLADDFKFKKIEEESVPGRAVYSITVNEFTDENPFESIADGTYFTVSADGKTSAASMVLVKTEYNAIPFKDEALVWDMMGGDTFYPMDGNEKLFYVQANSPYEIVMINSTTSTNNSKRLIKEGFELNKPQQRPGRYRGEMLRFTPIDNVSGENTDPDAYLGSVEFEIRSPNNLFETKRFKVILGSGIIQEEANTYLLQPGKMGILIPVKRVNTAHISYQTMLEDVNNSAEYALSTLGETQSWRPSVLWSDMEADGVKPVNIDGTAGIQAIYKWKEGSQGYIFVLPGKNKTGNALIDCSVFDTENIKHTLWSWHIWIVDDYPMKKGQKWLDRNLGAITPATSNDDTNILTYGMQYQFGRKDPFPPLTSKGYHPLVNSEGTLFNIKDVYNTHIMREVINNPTVMIRHKEHWLKESHYGSYRASGYRRVWHAIWGGDMYEGTDQSEDFKTIKSVFDPCPYGWKVPAYGQESNWENSGLTFPKAGYYEDGYVSRYYNKGKEALYGLSTVREGNHRARYIAINVNPNHYGRTTGRVIRCVRNEDEISYENYLPQR